MPQLELKSKLVKVHLPMVCIAPNVIINEHAHGLQQRKSIQSISDTNTQTKEEYSGVRHRLL